MAGTHGVFQWYELMTTDPEAAQTFYKGVVGWGTQATPNTEMKYTLFTAGEKPVAGVMEMPEELRNSGVPPSWGGYVGVDDVDHAAEHVKLLGGAECVPPTDIPGVGRFAVVMDPQSARFGLLSWSDPSMQPTGGQFDPGRIGWHELLANEWSAALEFYSAMFQWRKTDAMDMGEMGTYQIFANGEQTLGGMFNKPAAVPVPYWQYYFNVGAIDAAVERIKTGGGKIANGPMEVPGGKWIVHGIDPQGAMFALLGDKAAG